MENSKKVFIGGNWKCNNTLEQTKTLVETVINKLEFDENKVEVIISPISIHIPYVLSAVQKKVQISAQNSSLTGTGAYTGEISAGQILDLGLKWTILGHSERRQYYHETNELVADKTLVALNAGLKVIACIGEKLNDRESNETFNVVRTQLETIINKVGKDSWCNIVVAYEPVWAIGTGKVATPEQAQEVHGFIRKVLCEKVSKEVANSTRIIYGGSVNDKNSLDLIKMTDIDGFLVGGASLKSAFIDIVQNGSKK